MREPSGGSGLPQKAGCSHSALPEKRHEKQLRKESPLPLTGGSQGGASQWRQTGFAQSNTINRTVRVSQRVHRSGREMVPSHFEGKGRVLKGD